MIVAVNTILQKNLNICKFCSFMNFLVCEMARHTFLSLFQEYSNCACVNQTTSNRSAVVISGQCDSECNLLYYVFVPIGVIHFFFIFLNNTPVTVATLSFEVRTYHDDISAQFAMTEESCLRLFIFAVAQSSAPMSI